MEMCFPPTVFLCFWTKIPKSCFFLAVKRRKYIPYISGAFFNAGTSIPSFLHHFFQWGFYLHTLTAVSQLLYQNVFFVLITQKFYAEKLDVNIKTLLYNYNAPGGVGE